MTEQNDDRDIRRLLQAAGARENPPDDMRARVHAKTLEAWAELPQAKSRAPRVLAMAATIALLAVTAAIVLLDRQPSGPQIAGVAEIVYAQGVYSLDGAEQTDLIETHDSVVTGDSGRVMLRLATGALVHLDGDTTITLQAGDQISLVAGRVYVDSPGADGIRVVTPHATVTDIGTLFEVAVEDGDLTVVMREGEVDIALADDNVVARAGDGLGDMVRVSAESSVSRTTLATTDRRWDWVHEARPAYALAGSSVYEYASWAARDSGLTLTFDREIVERQAKLETFGGNDRRTSDGEAIRQTLETTRFAVVERAPYELVIDFRRDEF